MTVLWLQTKTGRAIGATAFIHGRRQHGPLVGDGRPVALVEAPAADARELAPSLALEQERTLDARRSHVESDGVRKHASPPMAVDASDPVAVARVELRRLDAAPPLGPALDCVDRVVDVLAGRVEAPGRQEAVASGAHRQDATCSAAVLDARFHAVRELRDDAPGGGALHELRRAAEAPRRGGRRARGARAGRLRLGGLLHRPLARLPEGGVRGHGGESRRGLAGGGALPALPLATARSAARRPGGRARGVRHAGRKPGRGRLGAGGEPGAVVRAVLPPGGGGRAPAAATRRRSEDESSRSTAG